MDVNDLVLEHGMCFGNLDGIPIHTAIDIFGQEAVDFACRLHTPGKQDDDYKATYGIGDYVVSFLTMSGCRVAATYVNCLEEKQAEQERNRNRQVKEKCRVITLFPEQHLRCKSGRVSKSATDVGLLCLQEKQEGDRFYREMK